MILDARGIYNKGPQPPGLPGGSDGKVSAHIAGDPSLIPGLGRSPGKGHGNPLQSSRLENADLGTVHALITWLSCTDHVTAHALMTWLFGH